MRKVLIIGGGIGGITTAIALRQKGFDVQVYENAPVLQAAGAGIVLAANAMQVLRRLGLEGEILAQGKLLRHFSILSQKGEVLAQTDSFRVSQQYGNDNFAIHRADLHRVLLTQLGTGVVHPGKRCTGFSQTTRGVQVNENATTRVTG